MKKTEEKLLTAIYNFSEMFNITPPRTSDIWDWWCDALKEMDISRLYFLRDIKVFENESNNVLIKMNNALIRRIEIFEVSSTFA